MKGQLNTVTDLLRKIAALWIDNVRLTVAEKLTMILSALILGFLTAVLGTLGFIFLLVAAFHVLALVLQLWACYAIVGGACLLILLLIWLLRKPLIINPIARALSKCIIEHTSGLERLVAPDDHDEEDDDDSDD